MWKLCAITNDKRRYSLTSRNNNNVRLSHETSRVIKEKKIKQYGEYYTQRLVLATWAAQETAVTRGKLSFNTALQERGVSEEQACTEQNRSGGGRLRACAVCRSHRKEEAATLELNPSAAPPKTKPKEACKPALDAQPALVTDFITPPQGSYTQRLKRVMALIQPKNQAELTELIAALGDENDNICWLAGSALINLGGLPVFNMLAAYLQTNSPPIRPPGSTKNPGPNRRHRRERDCATNSASAS